MVFGFGRKQPRVTFKQRVTDFWEWYPTVAERFYQAIEDGTFSEYVPEVSEFVDQTLPGLCWVFGPGESGGHSFTVTGGGVRPLQLLADYWQHRAPEISGWTFYGSRQASAPEQLANIAIGGPDSEQIDAKSFLIKTDVDAEAERIHIVAWHPAFERVPEAHHGQILFLLLDEALGEFGTELWIGDIKMEPLKPGDGIRSLAKLPEFIQQVREYHQWEKITPLEAYTVYQIEEQNRNRRGDVFIGSTCIPDMMEDFIGNKGRLSPDPLKKTGAEFVYLAIDGSVFPEGSELEIRGRIEDALHEALQPELSGRTLGGAMGRRNGYIDLLIFDGDESRRLIQQVLTDLQLQGRAKIETFA